MADQVTVSLMEIARECLNPRFDGWELTFEEGSNKFFRRLHPIGTYEWGAFFILDNMEMHKFIAIADDLDYTKHWNPTICEAKKMDINGKELIYWQSNYPNPISNRDYVFRRMEEIVDVDGYEVTTVHLKSVNSVYPEREGVIRVTDLHQIICIMIDQDKPSAIRISMYLHQDPKGYLPKWLINLVIKMHVKNHTKRLVEAYNNYDNWKQERKEKSYDSKASESS